MSALIRVDHLAVVPGRALIVLLLAGVPAAPAQAPHVVRAVPDNGDADVDPALSEIRIEFDQDMNPGGHSVCGGGPEFPKIAGKPRWSAKRTFIIPVTLEPGHKYSFSINCPAASNFRGANGEPAEVCPITFRTRAASPGAAPKPAAASNQPAIAALREAIDERYSYCDLRTLDWNALFAEFQPKLEKAQSPAEFGRTAAAMLARARDIHITVQVNGLTLPTYRANVTPNCDLKQLSTVVPQWKQQNERIYTGRFDDGLGYILIASWAREASDELESAYAALAESKDGRGLILDLRLNGGGDELLARQFAGCFIDQPHVYSRHRVRDSRTPDGFTPPIDRVVEPNRARPAYRGRVAVLMGPACVSTCESFLLMMRRPPQRLLFGAPSSGSSGNPKPVELGNGVTVFLPSWRDLLPDETPLEGAGIQPDRNVPFPGGAGDRSDPVLEAALKWLRE
jgi:hypothetical protein